MDKAQKQKWSWIFYDFANSAFTTSVVAGFFPVFFRKYWSAGVDSHITTSRLGIALGVAGVVMVVTKVFKLLTAVLMVNPLGAAVAALALGAFLIVDNWETVKTWFSTFFSWMKNSFAGLVNLLPTWLVNLPANLGKMTASLSRPTVQTIGMANSAMRVGGELRIKVETDSGTRARVTGLRSDNRNVPIDVDTGPMMVMP